MEGTLLGIRSDRAVAGDPHRRRGKIKWETPMALGSKLVRKVLEAGFPQDVLVNINFPDREPDEIAGIDVTTQGKRDQDLLKVVDRMDTRGNPYYWFGFERRRSDPPRERTSGPWSMYISRRCTST